MIFKKLQNGIPLIVLIGRVVQTQVNTDSITISAICSPNAYTGFKFATKSGSNSNQDVMLASPFVQTPFSFTNSNMSFTASGYLGGNVVPSVNPCGNLIANISKSGNVIYQAQSVGVDSQTLLTANPATIKYRQTAYAIRLKTQTRIMKFNYDPSVSNIIASQISASIIPSTANPSTMSNLVFEVTMFGSVNLTMGMNVDFDLPLNTSFTAHIDALLNYSPYNDSSQKLNTSLVVDGSSVNPSGSSDPAVSLGSIFSDFRNAKSSINFISQVTADNAVDQVVCVDGKCYSSSEPSTTSSTSTPVNAMAIGLGVGGGIIGIGAAAAAVFMYRKRQQYDSSSPAYISYPSGGHTAQGLSYYFGWNSDAADKTKSIGPPPRISLFGI